MATVLAGGTAVGVNSFRLNVYGAWTFITVWVWVLGLIYWLRYRLGPWRGMRVIEQVHHGHGRPPLSTRQVEPEAGVA
jgi:hypothetical protein